jgi:hypothetical protein
MDTQQLEWLQQAASFLLDSGQGPNSSSSSTVLASALAKQPAAEVLHTTLQAMKAATSAMDRLQECLGIRGRTSCMQVNHVKRVAAPGPLACYHVTHVRGSMLLLEVAAALVRQPAACKMLLEDAQSRRSLKGARI